MSFQVLTVAVVVALSFAYAAWTLMPQALRAALARLLLGLPIPGFMRQRLLASANASACGACSGCAKAPVSTANGVTPKLGAQAQPLVFHPRRAK